MDTYQLTLQKARTIIQEREKAEAEEVDIKEKVRRYALKLQRDTKRMALHKLSTDQLHELVGSIFVENKLMPDIQQIKAGRPQPIEHIITDITIGAREGKCDGYELAVTFTSIPIGTPLQIRVYINQVTRAA